MVWQSEFLWLQATGTTQASSSQKIIFNYLIIYQKANKVSELLRALELVTTKALGVQPDLVTLSF